MDKIKFETKIIKINNLPILRIPKFASSKLRSRGLTMVQGTINGFFFQTPLEPDGKGSHWFKLDANLQKKNRAKVGDTVKLEIEPSKDWPEPKLPNDIKQALNSASGAKEQWMSITPMARWDWIRWINSTKNPETRKIRIEKTISKFKSGKRRPCCFNRTECTDPEVSNRGMLLEA